MRGRISGGHASDPTLAGVGARLAIAATAASTAVEAWYLAIFHPGSISGPALALLVLAWAGVGIGVGAIVASVAGRRRTGLARAVPTWLLAGLVGLAVGGGLVALRDPVRPPAPAARSFAGPAAGARPNLVLVVVDTLRTDHLGCFGYERPTSPRLDRLSGEGVLFTRAISQASWTVPATASLLTGLFPSTHGAWSTRSRLPDDAVLLSEVLHGAGYVTAAFSANPHVSAGYGFDQGWDRFWLVPVVRGLRRTILVSALGRLDRMIDPDATLVDAVLRRVVRGPSNAARDVRLNAAVAAWLDASPGEPFFLYAHYMSAHRPFDAPAPYRSAFGAAEVAGPVDYPLEVWPFEPGPSLAPADRRSLIDHYDGAVLHADRMVGALMDLLAEHGVLDHTLVVVTADHGEEFYDHESWGHGQSLYQELIHVPLVLRARGRLPSGRRVDEVVMTVDVMPTVLELLGVPAPPGLPGHSLAGLLSGATPPSPGEAYAELHHPHGVAQALVRGERKLIVVRTATRGWTQRYDLARDPAERDDLGAPVDAGDVARLEALRRGAAAHALRAEPTEPGWREPLEALGYVE